MTDAASMRDVATDVAMVDSAQPGIDAQIACSNRELAYGGHCYFALGQTASFDSAKAACVGRGAHLVTITTAGENTALITINTASDRWIGLERSSADPAVDASYKWITGESRAGYSSWAATEPDGSGNCGRVEGGASGSWRDENCSALHFPLCERE